MRTTELPLPAMAREEGDWARYADRVAVIYYVGGKVSILCGHICSTGGSHLHVDNVSKVVAWFEEPYRLADDVNDAHERVFDVADPNLFLVGEIGLVLYPTLAKLWFGDMYSDEVLAQIRIAIVTSAFAQPKAEGFDGLLGS
ncbi:MAG: hypothetical protein EXS50_00965 [Candidatus Taylorbacteria bacterium]|nr:hypothetical protein [Candidatus Taylorbacteria bacterium]